MTDTYNMYPSYAGSYLIEHGIAIWKGDQLS